jgi:osmoprotectant transport system ATP-binding protein
VATRAVRRSTPARRDRARWPRAIGALLDEPFGALDAITRAELQDAFAALRERIGVTTVFVTHDLHEAILLGTTVAVLRGGRLGRSPRRQSWSRGQGDYVRLLLQRSRVTEQT